MFMLPFMNPLRDAMTWHNRGKVILNQARRNNSIIYGAQSIKKQIGFMARPTQDYDVLSNRPLRSARMLERKLDRQSGGNNYYVKPAQHQGTYKVKHIGGDMTPNTRDDLEVADYTKPERDYSTRRLDGNRYVSLSEVERDKRMSLSDSQFAFRHQKDREDLQRIKLARQMKIRYRPRFHLR